MAGRWMLVITIELGAEEKKLVCETGLCVNGFLKFFIKGLSKWLAL